jgi:hypothetical protein
MNLIAHLDALLARTRAVIERRRETDPGADDPVRGLYLPDAHLDHLFERAPTPCEPYEEQALLGLDAFDFQALLIALAPDLDRRFEAFYGYLNDDIGLRRATPGVVLELTGCTAWEPEARARLGPTGRLVGEGLVLIEEPERPFLSRSLRVPDAVTAHLLGDDGPDAELAPLTVAHEPRGDPAGILRALEAGASLCYVRGPEGAALAAAALGPRAVSLDLTRLPNGSDIGPYARLAARWARLKGEAVLAGPVECLAERGPPAVAAFAELPVPTILTGRRTWDPNWSQTVPFIYDVPPPDRSERAAAWHMSVNGDLSHGVDAAAVTGHLRMTPAQIERAATAARWNAIAAGRKVTAADLRAGARAQNAAGLERLSRRVEPRVTWDDLVLPPETLRPLRGLASRARHRELVLEEWGLRGRSGGSGHGIAALFAGPSGTGKTLAAEVIAAEIGLELYAIDLATVVDKYVGETEKNLDRIFTEADEVNAVLFFDEADALFGRRSDVRDAHDRYANIEVAFLLQRMESFDGIAILATNLRSNVDDAFTRRLDAIVDFQPPDRECRRRLWELCLGRSAPRAPDLDLDFCAEAFELAGGNIRSIALAAGYAAAERGGAIGMTDLIAAVEQEYRKLGRLCSEAEFGPWYSRQS